MRRSSPDSIRDADLPELPLTLPDIPHSTDVDLSEFEPESFAQLGEGLVPSSHGDGLDYSGSSIHLRPFSGDLRLWVSDNRDIPGI